MENQSRVSSETPIFFGLRYLGSVITSFKRKGSILPLDIAYAGNLLLI